MDGFAASLLGLDVTDQMVAILDAHYDGLIDDRECARLFAAVLAASE